MRDGERKQFLKGCKALRCEYEQKLFLLMSDDERRLWFEELDG